MPPNLSLGRPETPAQPWLELCHYSRLVRNLDHTQETETAGLTHTEGKKVTGGWSLGPKFPKVGWGWEVSWGKDRESGLGTGAAGSSCAEACFC